MWFLGDHYSDEYAHYFFTTKEKALEYIEKADPTCYTGKLTESNLEEIEVDDL